MKQRDRIIDAIVEIVRGDKHATAANICAELNSRSVFRPNGNHWTAPTLRAYIEQRGIDNLTALKGLALLKSEPIEVTPSVRGATQRTREEVANVINSWSLPHVSWRLITDTLNRLNILTPRNLTWNEISLHNWCRNNGMVDDVTLARNRNSVRYGTIGTELHNTRQALRLVNLANIPTDRCPLPPGCWLQPAEFNQDRTAYRLLTEDNSYNKHIDDRSTPLSDYEPTQNRTK